MDKKKDNEYEFDFESETLSLHSIHQSFHEEEDLSEHSTKDKTGKSRNHSFIVSQNLPPNKNFRLSNNFKKILKNLEGITIPQQARELRNISRDFLKNLDQYLEKKRTNLVSSKKPKSSQNLLTINRGLENNRKTIATLNKEYKELSKSYFKVTEKNYKETLEKERALLEGKIELYRKDINNMKLEESKRGVNIENREKNTKEILELEDQIALQRKKTCDYEQKLLDIELNREKTNEATVIAEENLKKIDEVAKFYKVKLSKPLKDFDNSYQSLCYKLKFLEARVIKLREEAPFKSINLDLKALKKKNALIKRILALETKDFQELLQSLLLQNRSISNCVEDPIKIPFVEEQLKKMGLMTHHSFYLPSARAKSIATSPPEKTPSGKKSIIESPQNCTENPLKKNIMIMEKDASVLHAEVELQIRELKKIVGETTPKNCENKVEGFPKEDKKEIFPENIINEKIDKNESVIQIKHDIRTKTIEEIQIKPDILKSAIEKPIESSDKALLNKSVNGSANDQGDQGTSQIIIEKNIQNNHTESIPSPSVNNIPENNKEIMLTEPNFKPKQQITEPEEIKVDPPKKTFNFARNKDYSSLFKDYDAPKPMEEAPKRTIENKDFFSEALNKEPEIIKPISRVIVDPNMQEDNQIKRNRKIMDPNEGEEKNVESKKGENRKLRMPATGVSPQKKTNVFESEVNYFSEFNL